MKFKKYWGSQKIIQFFGIFWNSPKGSMWICFLFEVLVFWASWKIWVLWVTSFCFFTVDMLHCKPDWKILGRLWRVWGGAPARWPLPRVRSLTPHMEQRDNIFLKTSLAANWHQRPRSPSSCSSSAILETPSPTGGLHCCEHSLSIVPQNFHRAWPKCF